jgi:hypothetical protein
MVSGVGAVAVAGPFAALLSAAGLAAVPAFVIAGVLAVTVAVWLARRLPRRLDELARAHRVAAVVWTVLAVAGAANLARMSYFMIDADATRASAIPGDDFYEHHNCLTAYYRAAVVDRAGAANVYEPTLYFGRDEDPPSVGMIGPFNVDPYEYPPPFLAAVRGALAVSNDFMTWRAAWFGLEVLLLIAALVALAAWIGGNEGLYALLLAPSVLFCAPVLLTLQVGNFQLAAIAIAVLALVAIERGRNVLGGSLLATITVFKVFPGLLLVYLLARRRWRASLTMVVASIALLALSVVVVGFDPFRTFVTFQLPRMSNGAAFPWLQDFVPAIAQNHSIFGIVVKLRAAGVPGMTFGVASKVAWVYSIVAVAIAWVLGRSTERDRGAEALVWLGLLQLATLRSPFAPDVYAVIAPLWIIALLVPRVQIRGRIVLAAAWIVLCGAVALLTISRPMGDGVRLIVDSAVQAVPYVLTYFALRPPRLTL